MERGNILQRESFLPLPPALARYQKTQKSLDLMMSI
jgi:hypothetical protein